MKKRSPDPSAKPDFPEFADIELSNTYATSLLKTLRELDESHTVHLLSQAFPILESLASGDSATISLSELLAIFFMAEGMLPQAGLSIQMGRYIKVNYHGDLSNILISAPNFRMAIKNLILFYHLKAPFLDVSLKERGDRASLSFDFVSPIHPSLRHIIIGLLPGAIFNVFEFYDLDTTEGIYLHLNPLQQQHIALYDSLFSLNPQQGKLPCTLTFPMSFLEVASPLANRELFELAVRNCENLQSNRPIPTSIVEQVEAMIVANPEKNWSQEALAEALHVSVSTLRRRFAKSGLSYKEVVNSAKMNVAKSFLLQDTAPITIISDRLGYSDPSNFARLFKSYTGLSPSEFRSKLSTN